MTFNRMQAMVKTYSHAKVHGQQSVGSEHGRTEAITLPAALIRSVITLSTDSSAYMHRYANIISAVPSTAIFMDHYV